ncbi:MAG: preprotein translocase subunit SecA [Patescibacteria group bacterium]
MSFLLKIFGDANKRVVDKYQKNVNEINAQEESIKTLSDAKIRDRIKVIREEVSQKLEKKAKQEEDNESLRQIENDILREYMNEVFTLTREAARRTLGQRHYDVQLVGGMVLHEGKIAEMMTGEGKTLVATLPAVLNAITGKGVHIVTVNDYLARRDAGWMGQVYNFLGVTVGTIIHDQSFVYDKDFEDENALDEKTKHLRPVSRKEAYNADVTYGTNNEFGFDYLRDNMVQNLEQMVQRRLHYTIVDEVDSILIDEARTPLIISAPAEESTDKYVQLDHLVKQLAFEKDYLVDEKQNAVTLTDEGIAHMEQLLGVTNIYEEYGIENVHHIEQALKANALFKKDKDYVVKDGEIVIVDEFTGRLMEGRRYSEGLHQAIEAKEGVEIKRESLTLATISFQNYFRLYVKLAGMTGTAQTEAEEFAKIYKLDVISIPPNNPNIRKDFSDVIYKNEKAKFLALVEKIRELNEIGRPVLVGTVSIEKNEILSELLKKGGVKHEVLNAKNHEKEALIISKAGQKGAVTVATNMAGRGTDIVLGGGVKDLGGLFVIGTERHESRRIDNQLRGRTARQGDPGSTQFFVSLDDDLMRIFGSERISGVMNRLGLPDNQPIQNSMISRSLESAQRKVEGHNFDIRKHLVEYDDIMNKQRAYIYKMRLESIKAENMKDQVFEIFENEAENLVTNHSDIQTGEIDIKELDKAIQAITGSSELSKSKSTEKTKENVIAILKEKYNQKETKIGSELMRILEKALFLRTIDMLWIDHLDAMTHLREGIGLRGYGQKDPLVEYKNESYNMFKKLLSAIDLEIFNLIFKAEISAEVATEPEAESAKTIQQATPQAREVSMQKQKSIKPKDKIGRNDPCWCGSGKKYKKCHGK